MKAKAPFLLPILTVLFLSCKHNDVDVLFDYIDHVDVILIAGQSNTLSGTGSNPAVDAPHPKVFQLGRQGERNLNIMLARDPLEHHSVRGGKIGFAMTFAKLYADELLENGRNILLIPCGHGGTGFSDSRWSAGDDLYEDAVYRVNYALTNFPDSKLVAILWHQGEKDVGNKKYQALLDSMIVNLRRDCGNDGTSLPFVLGRMIPYWVDQSAIRISHELIIKDTPNRIEKVGFASPRYPFVIQKEDNSVDEVHYDAEGQRELGKRYFEEYKKLVFLR